ncbi:adenosylmethionine--8-amino-7-oxononanoate transaminase [Tuwongella immobilis]|uniref:Adenosylmethionine-8-amino-7-oxononanoate aminotransferase n=1 Tax=Tuwongella immobilis TaxID=692036 RepID=A0A6C2YPP7_9BACT|nr:adenosylmethionine--8-amino-7-oxononanoate transaminase [Tuwongella immobilis]VIP03327.1 adenosylmethionine-8-amino-7-oxononanoate aminotransferase : Adenosylmethionine-8-amino-7-oxononanoate aminotransferase OS=Thermoanaerobacter kivui GN=bioA PE=3 SV=1: Aminotran_3 [Tuwongella immobilis]VTS04025.1 adenosylmethionine-8-amino-7-oxononanoate aminotransferase : Adenosylmethionine-8-amino-7-oxononanoate aminotransferase OS=Thermoanaerobacter kivui GN=bioA PE=3 SV=1: Aminotran_3 [Tuwongella immobi
MTASAFPSRQELEDWDRQHVWHPFTPMQEYAQERPLIIERAEGAMLYDLDGNAYIDGVSSMWCNVHGHCVPELDQAIHDQLGKVAHSTLLGIGNVPSIRLARKLAEIAPEGLTRVFFSDSGATAVEVALKMAFQFWQQTTPAKPQKTRFAALQGAYHGDTLGDVSVGDIGRFHNRFKPLLFETFRVPSPNCYRCPMGLQPTSCLLECVQELERLIEREAEQLAAVVIEPGVQGAAGMIPLPANYLRRLRDATHRHDVLLIADEVAVGFGRTGTMFACQHESVVPDFLCVAKGLSGGYLPMAATLTHDRIFQAFLGDALSGTTFFHGHTFTGNPLGAAVSLASIDRLLEGGVLAGLAERVQLLQRWAERLRDLPIVGNVRQLGLLMGVELVQNRETKTPFPAERRLGHHICRKLREQGVLIRPLRDVLVVMPPLGIDVSLLDRLCEFVYHAISTTPME